MRPERASSSWVRHSPSRALAKSSAVSVDGTAGPAHPHPRFYGTFPRVLGRYVRDSGVLELEDAVRKMTSANAAKIHQFDRGLLRPGAWADVTIFEPVRVADRATFEQPRQYATGIEYVIVNGTVLIDNDKFTEQRPGMVLKRTPGKKRP